jgi:hypothetical protein
LSSFFVVDWKIDKEWRRHKIEGEVQKVESWMLKTESRNTSEAKLYNMLIINPNR